MKKQEIIVSIEIREHYQVSSENRKSLIIIEMINAVEEYFSLTHDYYSGARYNDQLI
jgi:hypothetical protein